MGSASGQRDPKINKARNLFAIKREIINLASAAAAVVY